MNVRAGHKLRAEELMLLNCGVEDSGESLNSKEIKEVNSK